MCGRIFTFALAGVDVIISVLVTFVQDSQSLTDLNPAQFTRAKCYFVILGLQFALLTRALAVTKGNNFIISVPDSYLASASCVDHSVGSN